MAEKRVGVFRPIAFPSRFLYECERKYAINKLEILESLWGSKQFRYYVYGKRVSLLTVQPLRKPNRAHKQYSAKLTRWLDRLSPFDVNLQCTAGKNIPLTEYLSRNPITWHWNGTLIFKKRPIPIRKTDRLHTEKNRITKPDRLRIVGKVRDNERLQEYRTSQKGR